MGKKRKERRMTFAEFRQVVGDCSEDEVDRLRTRYKRYYREHRVLFTDFLAGEYPDEKVFFDKALEERLKAIKERKTFSRLSSARRWHVLGRRQTPSDRGSASAGRARDKARGRYAFGLGRNKRARSRTD
jgi:hypothetical protein